MVSKHNYALVAISPASRAATRPQESRKEGPVAIFWRREDFAG